MILLPDCPIFSAMIWRYFHKIGPHSVGGSRRVDSRNIAASIVPFLRLPHPHDIYDFIMGGSLCWGMVEMSNNYTPLKAENLTNKDLLNVLKEGRKRSGQNRTFSVNRPLKNGLNTRKNSAPTLNTVDDYGLAPSNYEYGLSDTNWNTLEKYSRIDPDRMSSNENETRLKHFKALKKKIINAYKNKKEAYNKLNQSNKIRNTFRLKFPFSLRRMHNKLNVTITNKQKQNKKASLPELYNTMRLTINEVKRYKEGQKLFKDKPDRFTFSIKDDIFKHISSDYNSIKEMYNNIHALLNDTITPDYQDLMIVIEKFNTLLKKLLTDAPLKSNANTPDYQDLMIEIEEFNTLLKKLLTDAPLKSNVKKEIGFFNGVVKLFTKKTKVVYRPERYDLIILTKLTYKLHDCLIELRAILNIT